MSELFYLEPQEFHPKSVTQLPALDLYEYCYQNLPGIYKQAPNFTAMLKALSIENQYLYDIIRSLINVWNLNNTKGNETYPAIPSGIYLNMLANMVNAQYSALSLSTSTYNAIQNTISYLNSRGRISDYYTYFKNNGLEQYFNNDHIFVDANATLVFSLPIQNTPLNPPNPYAIFQTSMSLLKAMGIKIEVLGANVPFVQYGSLPTDVPPYEVAAGNAGYGVLLLNGEVINGGFFKAL